MELFPKTIESERLRYERLHPDDVDPFELYKYVKVGAPDIEEITRYVTWDPYENPKTAFDWVEQAGNDYEEGTGVHYLVRPKAGDRAGELAGMAGIGVDWDLRRGTLGTWFRKPFWGRGYSGERAARMLKLAFERLDLEVVTVSHDPDNEPSQRAIEKYVERFGGRKEGYIRNDIVMNGEPRDTVRYSIAREEWERHSTR